MSIQPMSSNGMKKCVVTNYAGEYLVNPRRSNKRMKDMDMWSEHLHDAKIFGTPGAAARTANLTGVEGYHIREALIVIGKII